MRNRFIRLLATFIGADIFEQEFIIERVEALENAFMEKAAELEKVQEVMSVLVMTNPNIKVVAPGQTMGPATSGSSGGRVLN